MRRPVGICVTEERELYQFNDSIQKHPTPVCAIPDS